jgi:hypothetical protein
VVAIAIGKRGLLIWLISVSAGAVQRAEGLVPESSFLSFFSNGQPDLSQSKASAYTTKYAHVRGHLQHTMLLAYPGSR